MSSDMSCGISTRQFAAGITREFSMDPAVEFCFVLPHDTSALQFRLVFSDPGLSVTRFSSVDSVVPLKSFTFSDVWLSRLRMAMKLSVWSGAIVWGLVIATLSIRNMQFSGEMYSGIYEFRFMKSRASINWSKSSISRSAGEFWATSTYLTPLPMQNGTPGLM